MINEQFANEYSKMKVTSTICFGLKNCITTLQQAKIIKHECHEITAVYYLLFHVADVHCPYFMVLVLTYFCLIKHSSRMLVLLIYTYCIELALEWNFSIELKMPKA